jgi:uncharacterized integral membrane protein (TIGR00697 family)
MNNNLLNEIAYEKQSLKHFHVLSVLYILGILTSITVSARLFPFEIPFTHITIFLTGGTWTIPFTFFIQDITTEVYGYAKSKQLLLLSIPVVVIYITYLKFTTLLPIPNVPNISNSYNDVFNALPRHLIALLAALAIGTLVNNFVLSKLKTRFKGKYLPIRFISSTAIGEAALQIIGTTIAWVGSLSFTTEILPFVIFSYFYKIAFEAIMTPVNIYVCNWLKRDEGIDVYDN